MKTLLNLAALAMLLISCQKEDQSGRCGDDSLRDKDIACNQIYKPVCGCDGETYSNACEAKFGNGITRYSEGACGCEYPYTGNVVDYTGLDGCGLMIELNNGDRLEPVKLPDGFVLKEGQYLKLNYSPLTHVGSICMAGTIAHITCVAEIESGPCYPVYFADIFDDAIWDTHLDDLNIKHASIAGDCLTVELSYGGGCSEHDFELVLQPVMCIPPSVEVVQLTLLHNANGDACEALITDNLSFDLSSIRINGVDSLQIELSDNKFKLYPEKLVYKY